MSSFSSIAMRVCNLEAMLAFYSAAFQVEFREVETYGIRSQFGELNGITLKFVPMRDEADFKGYPVHQPGFTVADVESVVRLALQHGGRLEGRILRTDGRTQAARRGTEPAGIWCDNWNSTARIQCFVIYIVNYFTIKPRRR